MVTIRFPVSIKGIIKDDNNRFLVVKNERNEWELPGGRIELGETPEETVVREVKEELNLHCVVSRIIDSWTFEVLPDKHVFIVTYECMVQELGEIKISEEHLEYRWVTTEQLAFIRIPEDYKKSILKTIN